MQHFQIKTGQPARDILAPRFVDAEGAIISAQRQVREREVDCAVVLSTEQSPIDAVVYRIWRDSANNIHEDNYQRV